MQPFPPTRAAGIALALTGAAFARLVKVGLLDRYDSELGLGIPVQPAQRGCRVVEQAQRGSALVRLVL